MDFTALEKSLGDLTILVKSFKTDIEKKLDDHRQLLDSSDSRIKYLEDRFKSSLKGVERDKEGLPKQKWSWVRVCRALATKDWGYARFEKEEIDKHVEKTMQATGGTTGGALIPPQYIAELIDVLRPTLVAAKLGVTILTGLVGSPVTFPKKTSKTSLTWVAPEGTGPTAQDFTTGSFQLMPRKGMTLTKISNDLITLANPAIEELVRADISAGIREGIDASLFRGTGFSGQPRGLEFADPAINVTNNDWDAGTDDKVKLNKLKDCVKRIDSVNALTDGSAWAMNVTSYYAIDKLYDLNGRPYLVPDPQNPSVFRLLGYPVAKSTAVSETTTALTDNVWFGNWADMILAIWTDFEVSASDQTSTAFQNDELWMRGIIRTDNGIRRHDSFTRLQEVK